MRVLQSNSKSRQNPFVPSRRPPGVLGTSDEPSLLCWQLQGKRFASEESENSEHPSSGFCLNLSCFCLSMRNPLKNLCRFLHCPQKVHLLSMEYLNEISNSLALLLPTVPVQEVYGVLAEFKLVEKQHTSEQFLPVFDESFGQRENIVIVAAFSQRIHGHSDAGFLQATNSE